MIRPEIKNFDQVKRQVDRWMQKARQEAQETAKGLTVTLLTRLVQNSPQWTGDFASNWRYSIGTPDLTYDSGDVAPNGAEGSEPWKQFSRPAIQLGLAKNRGKDYKFKLGDTVYVSNSSTHDTTYAKGVYDGTIKLRDVNSIVKLSSVVQDFNAEYAVTLSPSQAKTLSRRQI